MSENSEGTKIDRRSFLKRAATTAGLIAAGAVGIKVVKDADRRYAERLAQYSGTIEPSLFNSQKFKEMVGEKHFGELESDPHLFTIEVKGPKGESRIDVAVASHTTSDNTKRPRVFIFGRGGLIELMHGTWYNRSGLKEEEGIFHWYHPEKEPTGRTILMPGMRHEVIFTYAAPGTNNPACLPDTLVYQPAGRNFDELNGNDINRRDLKIRLSISNVPEEARKILMLAFAPPNKS